MKMNEGFPQAEQIVPPADAQIAEEGMITQAPVTAVENGQGMLDQEPAVANHIEHGGYATGVRVGEMANKIANLQAQGKWEEANALTAQLNALSHAVPTEAK
jgi:hypothetical protein